MNIKNKFNSLTKNLINGSVFGFGLAMAVIWVTAFQSLWTNPSDSWNQSLSSPIAANMINYNDCQTKSSWIDTPSEFILSCDAWYVIVEHDCQLNRPGYWDSNRYWRSYCISERTSAWIHQLRVQSRMYSWAWTASNRSNSWLTYIDRAWGHASVMCCKLGL